MADTDYLTIGEFNKYKEECETDRKKLTGNVDGHTVILRRLELKTDNQTTMMQPLVDMFKGMWANPKIQAAMIAAVISGLGYVAWKLNSMTAPQQNNQPIIVFPQMHQQDAGWYPDPGPVNQP